MKLIRGNYDELACPLPSVEVYHDHDRDETGATPEIIDQTPCGMTLHLVIEGSLGLAAFEGENEPTRVGPNDLDVYVWRVECEAGHVLAHSTYDGYGGDRPHFNLSWLPFEIPPAEPKP